MLIRTALLITVSFLVVGPASGEVARIASPLPAAAVSPGSIAYESGGRRVKSHGSWLEVASIGGVDARRVTDAPAPGSRRRDIDPEWSPDGTMLAFTRIDDTVGGLYIVAADGTGLRRLYSFPKARTSLHPTWSPDGTMMAFALSGLSPSCDKHGSAAGSGVYVVNADGSAAPIAVAKGSPHLPAFSGEEWSPDGKSLLFVQSERSCGLSPYETLLYRVNVDGSGRRLLARGHHGTVGRASWSSDGKQIAYTNDCGIWPGGMAICTDYLMNADGSHNRGFGATGSTMNNTWCGSDAEPTMLAAPIWEPNRQRIIQADDAGIYELDTDTGKARRVVAVAFSIPEWYTLSRDGTKVAFIDGDCSQVSIGSLTQNIVQRVATPAAWGHLSAPALWLP
jgi:Tol biopolymer transport system component